MLPPHRLANCFKILIFKHFRFENRTYRAARNSPVKITWRNSGIDDKRMLDLIIRNATFRNGRMRGYEHTDAVEKFNPVEARFRLSSKNFIVTSGQQMLRSFRISQLRWIYW